MANAKAHNNKKSIMLRCTIATLFAAAVVAMVMFVAVGQAQGSGEADSSTLGVSSAKASQEETRISAESRISGTQEAAASTVPSEAADPTDTAQRFITVKDPDPVVVPVAVDTSNSLAVEKANQYATLDPLPTAPRIAPDLSDGTWSSGIASGYNITSNDDGKGNFGVTTTASGIALSDSGVTVAVPASKSYLLGRIVEICYDGKVVFATVTDTGGFESLGRALDLAPGVYKAFGASSWDEWGTRTVHYRFL